MKENKREDFKKKKELLRKDIIRRRDMLSIEERLAKSRSIQSNLFKLPCIAESQNIFFYVSFRSEVHTHEMIKALLSTGKTIAVPVTDMKNKRLLPSLIRDFDSDLALGTMGIMEPKPEKAIPVSLNEIDLVITPGVAFCEQGWRIGYGGGFYDRFFCETKKKSYALAFELQIVDDLPFDPQFDRAVDCIVTESRVISCKDYASNDVVSCY